MSGKAKEKKKAKRNAKKVFKGKDGSISMIPLTILQKIDEVLKL